MQYLDLLSKLSSLLAPLVKWLQKKYYVSESLDFHEVHFDYYPESFESEKMFAFKVSPIPMDSQDTLRKTLTFTLINKTEKPIKVVDVQLENKRDKTLPLDPLADKLPKVLEPFIGELPVSIIIDQLWAYAMYEDKRFTHPFSSLFFFDNLTMDFFSVVYKLADDTLIRHTVSKKMLAQLKEVFNPAPKTEQSSAPETKCSVDGCDNEPDYIVLLYDHYNNGSIFFEQDFTCPFLCEKHMQENERGVGNKGVGKRRYPRSDNSYPYSNCDGALGYTKYLPLA